jgi:hypothetical protein
MDGPPSLPREGGTGLEEREGGVSAAGSHSLLQLPARRKAGVHRRARVSSRAWVRRAEVSMQMSMRAGRGSVKGRGEQEAGDQEEHRGEYRKTGTQESHGGS